MYIDCHAHLFFSPIPAEAIDEDITGEIPTPNMDFIGKMISNAKKKGVRHIVGVISNPNDFTSYQEQLKLENIIHVIGISRNSALEDQSHMISQLEKEIERKVPHGIGEIGLEYLYGFDKLNEHEKNTFKKKQRELFGRQIQLAKEIDVPIVVHAGYGTDKDLVEILKHEQAQEVGVQIHGYMSKVELVSELLDMGFYFSFGYNHPREEELKRIIEITPLERILVETDAPFHIMDSPKRFILPEDVVLITDEIANLKEIEPEVFINQVLRNARELFRF
ncbi:MAG: TatD family hydrolase [Candidatus Lokiarchaeota archaeon]|nr:TatD family hydrolase [Candidatus Lokiarchaeota archaeon]